MEKTTMSSISGIRQIMSKPMLGRLWTHKKFSALVHGGNSKQDSKEWLSLVHKHQELIVRSGTEEMYLGENRRTSDSAHYRFGFYSAREGRRHWLEEFSVFPDFFSRTSWLWPHISCTNLKRMAKICVLQSLTNICRTSMVDGWGRCCKQGCC